MFDTAFPGVLCTNREIIYTSSKYKNSAEVEKSCFFQGSFILHHKEMITVSVHTLWTIPIQKRVLETIQLADVWILTLTWSAVSREMNWAGRNNILGRESCMGWNNLFGGGPRQPMGKPTPCCASAYKLFK